MESLPTERYCRRGRQCKLYDPRTGRSQKLGRYHQGELCRQCEQDKDILEDAPEEHRELFLAAWVLFNEGVAEEYVVVPTIAFAANSSENLELRSVRDKFAEVQDKFATAGKGNEARRSKEWRKLDDRFFYNPYVILEPLRVADEVLIVRSLPIETLNHVDKEADSIVQVDINVFDPRMTKDEVSESYERHLLRFNLPYQEGRGDVGLREDPHSTDIQVIAFPELDTRRPVFPGRETIGRLYDFLHERLTERLAKQIKKTKSKEPHNLIPACVYWYVGNRGEVLKSPRGSDLQRKTYDMVVKHLVERLPEKIRNKILVEKARRNFPRDARAVEQQILRVDRLLRR